MNRAAWQKRTLGGLVSVTVALFGLTVSESQAQQQGTVTPVPAEDALEEIVVTATRREETISHTPLSITAFTQQTLSGEEMKTISDLQRIIPGLGLTYGGIEPNAESSSDTNISLRGIASASGAATTGVYIDDVPTHKFAVPGSGMGAEYPQLFDLDRVEALRGPQGTLYGGSTMGGAIRFISTPPSLTEYSGNVKAEGGFTQGGDPTYETGAAFGGPIIPDTLAFRVTAWTRNQGGYLDHVSRFTGDTLATDTNREESNMFRAQLLWSPVESLRIKASFLYQTDLQEDLNYYWFNTPAINAPAEGWTAVGKPCASVPITKCATVLPAYTYPAYGMFGPYNNGDELYNPTTGAESAVLSPRLDHFYMPSLNIDYDAGPFTLHSITGYQSDAITGFDDNSYRSGPPAFSNTPAYPANFYYTFPQFFGEQQYGTYHDATSQELRFVSNPNGTPFSWIAGFYYYIDRLHKADTTNGNLVQEYAAVLRATPQTILGYPLPATGQIVDSNQYNDSRNESVYLDMSYAILENLKLEAGIRYSRDTVDTTTVGLYANNHGNTTATIENGGIILGNASSTANTPKVGVTWQINEDDMVYTSAAKGYRAGGYNAVPQFALVACQSTLQELGIVTPPTRYAPDDVWTYELGSKVRELNGRLQLDTSIFRTNWSHVQSQLTIPNCGQYTGNADSAVVQGVDLQGAIKLGDATFSVATEFTDATYTSALYLPTTSGPPQLSIADHDRMLGVPLWSGNAGIKYDLHIFGKTPFIRADYDFSSGARRSTGPGTVGYTSTVYKAQSTNFLTLGAGMNYTSQLQFLFNVKNATNSHTPLLEYGGDTTTRNSPVLFGTTFAPREYDIDVLYHF